MCVWCEGERRASGLTLWGPVVALAVVDVAAGASLHRTQARRLSAPSSRPGAGEVSRSRIRRLFLRAPANSSMHTSPHPYLS